MKTRFVSFLLTVLLLIMMMACSQKSSQLHTINIDNTQELHEFFKYTGKGRTIISGHRGGVREGYPENSIAALKYTLRHTPAIFEIDPRLTQDSVIVLMHDATLERTTTGTGKLVDYTWEELQQFKLTDAQGDTTSYGIPSLAEVIEWSEDKTIINLDKKDVPMPMIAQIIQKHEAAAHVIVTVHNAEEAAYYYNKNEKIMFSAWVKTKQAFREYAEAIPWQQIAIAYVGPELNSQTKELMAMLHKQDVMAMIGAAPSYDKLSPKKRANAYRKLVETGVDVIESDLPVEVAKAIAPLIPEEGPKQRFFGVQ